jgi:putative nucleotidyltransferase-like protein
MTPAADIGIEGKLTRPQAERRIILLSAGTASRRQAMRREMTQLATQVDWQKLTTTLRSRRLLPPLGPRILELAREHVGADFSTAVEQSIEAGRQQSTFLQLVSQRVMAALADAEIRSTTLKGPQLSEAIYGDPGRRLSNDVDLLVAPDQLHAAVEVVRALGYRPPTDYVYSDGLPQLHFALVHEQRKLPPIELHWRIHWYERDFAQERLLSPTVDSQSSWRPAPPDELAALLQFYARDGFAGLRMATDLAAWWDMFGADLKTGALDELVDAYPSLGRIIPAAARAGQRMVGLPAERVFSRLSRPGLRDRAAIRLADPHPDVSKAQLYAEMGLIDGLLTPRGGFRAFIRRQLILPREVMDEHDQHVPGRTRSSFGYGARVLIRCGVLARYGLALIRMTRTRETSPISR